MIVPEFKDDKANNVAVVQARIQNFLAQNRVPGPPPEDIVDSLRQLGKDIESVGEQITKRLSDKTTKELPNYAAALDQLRIVLRDLEVRLHVSRAELESEKARLRATRCWTSTTKQTL
jgi:hypothetical protein